MAKNSEHSSSIPVRNIQTLRWEVKTVSPAIDQAATVAAGDHQLAGQYEYRHPIAGQAAYEVVTLSINDFEQAIDKITAKLAALQISPEHELLRQQYLVFIQDLKSRLTPAWAKTYNQMVADHEAAHALQEIRLGAMTESDRARALQQHWFPHQAHLFPTLKTRLTVLEAMTELQAMVEGYTWQTQRSSHPEVMRDGAIMALHWVLELLAIDPITNQTKLETLLSQLKNHDHMALASDDRSDYHLAFTALVLELPNVATLQRNEQTPIEVVEQVGRAIAVILAEPQAWFESLTDRTFRLAVDQSLAEAVRNLKTSRYQVEERDEAAEQAWEADEEDLDVGGVDS